MFFLKKAPCFVWCLALTAFIVFIWHAAFPTFSHSFNSPYGVYRLEFHQASLLQRIAHHDLRMPYVVRLYRVWPKTLLHESEVVDLQAGGQIDWLLDAPAAINAVSVGTVLVFKDIPSECASPPLSSGCPANP